MKFLAELPEALEGRLSNRPKSPALCRGLPVVVWPPTCPLRPGGLYYAPIPPIYRPRNRSGDHLHLFGWPAARRRGSMLLASSLPAAPKLLVSSKKPAFPLTRFCTLFGYGFRIKTPPPHLSYRASEIPRHAITNRQFQQ